MQMIGIVETRYFGGPHELSVRILKDDDNYFDLPISLEQASMLLAETDQAAPVRTRQPAAPPATPPTTPNVPSGFEDEDGEEMADTDSIRLATFPGGGGGEDEEGNVL